MSIAFRPTEYMPKDTDDAHIFKSFIDPLTLDVMQDPVIDQCGHTFDRQSILDYQRSQGGRNQVKCPLRQVDDKDVRAGDYIYIDQLRPNLALRELIQSVQKLEGKKPEDLLFKTSLKMEAQAAQLEQSNRIIAKLQEQNAFLKEQNEASRRKCDEVVGRFETLMRQCEQLEQGNRPLREQNERLDRVVQQLNNNNALLSSQAKTRQTQIQNLLNVSGWDRFLATIDCCPGKNYNTVWMNRGIEPNDLALLNEVPRQIEQTVFVDRDDEKRN